MPRRGPTLLPAVPAAAPPAAAARPSKAHGRPLTPMANDAAPPRTPTPQARPRPHGHGLLRIRAASAAALARLGADGADGADAAQACALCPLGGDGRRAALGPGEMLPGNRPPQDLGWPRRRLAPGRDLRCMATGPW